jgi:hypothetical protein
MLNLDSHFVFKKLGLELEEIFQLYEEYKPFENR